MNLPEKLADIVRDLERLNASGLMRSLHLIEGTQGAEVVLDGKRVILLCSNNYLGLATHPEIRRAMIDAVWKYGVGAAASRLISGNMALHIELEERIASFKETESALIFNSGYHANTGIIPALVGRGDIILSDELNHASIIDGCRMSRADTIIYPHRDVNFVEDVLKKSRHRRKLLATDGVFSMDGDLAPLPELVEVCRRYNAYIMVDEAHATGVLGANGRGLVQHFGLTGKIDIVMGTLGKALGCFGAYAATNRYMYEYLLNTARSFIFTTALPPPVCAAALKAIEIVEKTPALLQKLQRNIRKLKTSLKTLGIDINNEDVPIIPIIIGEPKTTMEICRGLLERGLFIQGVRPPSVPEGTSRLRLTITAEHEERHISALIEALGDFAERIPVVKNKEVK